MGMRESTPLEVFLTVDEQAFLLPVALAPQLPYPVVLGQDIPILVDLLPKAQTCNVVMTMSQIKTETLRTLPFFGEEVEGKGRLTSLKRTREGKKCRVVLPWNPVSYCQSQTYGRCSRSLRIFPGRSMKIRPYSSGLVRCQRLSSWWKNISSEAIKGGTSYILVACVYATKYPEAFPLRNIKTFSLVGLPREVLTDQGTNFPSDLLRQVYQLLGIKGIKTTPYHPQTDGLVEGFNWTLKRMLRKFVSQAGTDWDQWLPYLLFACWEVPQASTGFSPFELLYCRQVRGPLDLLKEFWEGPWGESKNVGAYVLQMHEWLEQMTALARENMVKAQRSQKTWYDHNARDRAFVPGRKCCYFSLLMTASCWQSGMTLKRSPGKIKLKIKLDQNKRGIQKGRHCVARIYSHNFYCRRFCRLFESKGCLTKSELISTKGHIFNHKFIISSL